MENKTSFTDLQSLTESVLPSVDPEMARLLEQDMVSKDSDMVLNNFRGIASKVNDITMEQIDASCGKIKHLLKQMSLLLNGPQMKKLTDDTKKDLLNRHKELANCYNTMAGCVEEMDLKTQALLMNIQNVAH